MNRRPIHSRASLAPTTGPGPAAPRAAHAWGQRGPSRRRLLAMLGGLVLGVAALSPREASGQQLPPDFKATLLLRVVAYNRTFVSAPTSTATIAVLYPESNAEAETEQRQLVAALERLQRSGAKVSKKRIDPHGVAVAEPAEQLEEKLRELKVSVIFVCDGFDEATRKAIQTAARTLSALTLTSTDRYRGKGFSVLLTTQAERAKLVIDLSAARAEGAVLDPRMLSLAEVINRGSK